MKLSELVKEIISEWAYRLDDGTPNPKNTQHIRVLSEVLDVMGLTQIKEEIIENLLEDDKQFKNPALNKVITYKSVNGEDAEGKVGNLLRRPKDEDAHQKAIATLGGEDSDTYKKAMADLGGEGQPEKDVEKEKEKEGDGGKEKEQPQKGSSVSPDTEAGKAYIDSLPDTDAAKKTKEKDSDVNKTDFEKLKTSTVETKKAQLSDARERIEAQSDINDDTKKAFEIFEENFDKLLNAQSNEERLEAIQTLSDNGFLARNGNGSKLYISNLPLPSKQMTGDGGDAFGKLVNKLAEDNEIDIPLRDESSDSALADVSGKHNEAGVVAILFPTEQNTNEYNELKDSYASYGGDEKLAHQQNEKAAEQIQSEIQSIFPNSKIKGAKQIGGLGKNELEKLGINNKKDPTDVIVEIELEDGTTKIMKFSMKVYSDPNNITMKNSGLGNASTYYLGDSKLDENLKKLRETHNYLEKGISPEEKSKRKREFREAYLSEFSSKMVELSKSDEGQQKLLDMWKDVHGCGNDVFTSVTNKKTGKTDIYPPEHYCEPEIPFNVEYDGVKVVIRMGNQSDSFLELVCKTESTGSPKLLFNHKKQKKK